jgi:hypothetical protein
MQTATARTAPATEAIGDICRRVAMEIELLRNMAARLELSLCVMTVTRELDDERVRDLQQLDFMHQHLAALRDFLNEISRQATAHDRVNPMAALDRVPLSELRGRLAGAGPPDKAEAAESGRVEFL